MPPLPDDAEGDAYSLTLVAAGFAAAELQMIIEDNVLKVSGHSKRTGAHLKRCVRLPRDADVDGMVAVHVDGILTVRVPTKPDAKPQSIRVNASNAQGADNEDMVLASTAAAESDKK